MRYRAGNTQRVRLMCDVPNVKGFLLASVAGAKDSYVPIGKFIRGEIEGSYVDSCTLRSDPQHHFCVQTSQSSFSVQIFVKINWNIL